MSDNELFMRALNLVLKLSAVGSDIMEVRYYTGINELIVSFWDKTATAKVGWNITELDLMQLAIEIIRTETGGRAHETQSKKAV